MLKAIKNRVIVKRSEEQKVSAGGIVLQRDISEQVFAVIVDVGPEVQTELKAGDQLVIDWRQVGVMPHEGQTYYVVTEDNILAIVEE